MGPFAQLDSRLRFRDLNWRKGFDRRTLLRPPRRPTAGRLSNSESLHEQASNSEENLCKI